MTPEQNIIFDELEQKAQGKVAALLATSPGWKAPLS
jgi:hypothetical protein